MKKVIEGIPNPCFEGFQMERPVKEKKETAWTTRKTKITINIFMAITFILSYTLVEGMMMFHIFIGTICSLLFIAHVWVNKNWLTGVMKARKAGNMPAKTRRIYKVSMALIVVWSICIITGFPALGHYFWGIESLQVLGHIHDVTAGIGLILIIVHIFQHKGQIKSYLKRSKSADNSTQASLSQ